jgi:putative transposase
MTRALVLVACWIAAAHDRWRTRIAGRRPLRARIDNLEENLRRLCEENDLLQARLRRLDPRRRPRYRPFERLSILWHQARHGLSVRTIARTFVVSVQTVVNWRKDVARGQARLVRGKHPGNGLPNIVEELVHLLKREWPRWGTRRVAGILARMGLDASRSSVQRIHRRPHRPIRRASRVQRGRGPLLARRPGQMWLLDFTRLGGVFRAVRVGAVIDAFSRRVLAIGVVRGEPKAAFAVRLLREAIAEAGPPAWVVTDRGRQFTSRAFTRALLRRGIRRRFGAIGRSGSIALIERFWRSMKQEYARGIFLYQPLRSIEADLENYAEWFNTERPHQGLGDRTPEEVHEGQRRPPLQRAPGRATICVRHLGNDRALPILRLRRAA